MITPSYAVTATERVLPRMALDFTTGVLDPRVTVTRALNTATRINSSGLVEIVNANLPRFDYNPVTLAPKGLLIEELRTNLAQQSADFTTAFWSKTSVNLTTGIDDPAGGTSATTLTATSASGSLQQPVVGGVSGTTYSASFWIRRRTGTGQISLRCGDLTAIPVTVTSSWVRYTVTAVASTATVRLAVVLTTSGDAVDVWGAQIEAGAFATSYIPTLASQVTRNADVVSMTGTNFSSWFNASAGAFMAEWSSANPITVNTSVVVSANDGTNNNYIELYQYQALTAGAIYAGNVLQADIGRSSPAVVPNTVYKAAMAFTTNSVQYARNASLGTQDNLATIPTVDRLTIGSRNSARFINGPIARISAWPQRLINAEVQAFSK